MAKLRLMLDPNRLTIGDLVDMESGFQSPVNLRDFLTRFVVNETDKPIDEETAIETINALTVAELFEAVNQLYETAQTFVPPQPGGN